jgi:hypothetical protein
LIPKLGASGSLYVTFYVLIPKLGASGSLWEPLVSSILRINSQAGSLWEPLGALGACGEPLYVLIPKLGASGSLWGPPGASGSFGVQNGQNTLLFGIPIRRGRMGCRIGQIYQIYIWEPPGATLCIDSQAGSLWEPLGACGEPFYVLIRKLGTSGNLSTGSLWVSLGASGSLWEPLCYPLCIDAQAGSLWMPLGASGFIHFMS